MIKHIWSVACRQSIVDNRSNNVSLLDCLEEIRTARPLNPVDGKPINNFIIPISFEVVSFLGGIDPKTGADFELKTDIIGPGDIENGKNVQKISVPAGNKRIRQINKVNGLPVSASGVYIMRISIKETNDREFRKIGEIPIEINIDSPDAP